MGVDFYANAVIGLKLSEKDVVIKRMERNCNHQMPDDAKFCPTCGQKGHTEYEEHKEKIGGYTVVYSTDNYDAVLAMIRNKCDAESSSKNKPITNFEEQKQKFKDDLIALGLWNEENFGLWAVPYVSY